MSVSMIAAMSAGRVIGAGNRLPWSLPEDLKRFRAITRGHPVIMGRKTYESIGRLLPERENVIVSGQAGFVVSGATTATSVRAAVERYIGGPTEAFVIGGAQIYEQALPYADKLYLTIIDRSFDGDALFPEWDAKAYREVSREERTEPFPFRFITLEKLR